MPETYGAIMRSAYAERYGLYPSYAEIKETLLKHNSKKTPEEIAKELDQVAIGILVGFKDHFGRDWWNEYKRIYGKMDPETNEAILRVEGELKHAKEGSDVKNI